MAKGEQLKQLVVLTNLESLNSVRIRPGIPAPKQRFKLAGAVRQCDCEAYRVGGIADPVHLVVRLSRSLSVADLVKEVKSASSKWLKNQEPGLADFHWQ